MIPTGPGGGGSPLGAVVNQDTNPGYHLGWYDPQLGYIGTGRGDLVNYIMAHPGLRTLALQHFGLAPISSGLGKGTLAVRSELMGHVLAPWLEGRGFHNVVDVPGGYDPFAGQRIGAGKGKTPPPKTKPTNPPGNNPPTNPPSNPFAGLPKAPNLGKGFAIINPKLLAQSETAAQYGPQLRAVIAAMAQERGQSAQDVADLNKWYTDLQAQSASAATADAATRQAAAADQHAFATGLLNASGGSASSAAGVGAHTAVSLSQLMSDLGTAASTAENARTQQTAAQGALAVQNQQNASRQAMLALQQQQTGLLAARGSAYQANLQNALQTRDQELAARAAAQLSGAQFGLARATTASNLQTATAQRKLLIANGLGSGATGPGVFVGANGIALHDTAEKQIFGPLQSGGSGKLYGPQEAWAQLATLATTASGKRPALSQASFNWVKNEWRAYLGQYVNYQNAHGKQMTVAQFMQANGTPFTTAIWHRNGAKWV